jgi:hypothetical protein
VAESVAGVFAPEQQDKSFDDVRDWVGVCILCHTRTGALGLVRLQAEGRQSDSSCVLRFGSASHNVCVCHTWFHRESNSRALLLH